MRKKIEAIAAAEIAATAAAAIQNLIAVTLYANRIIFAG